MGCGTSKQGNASADAVLPKGTSVAPHSAVAAATPSVVTAVKVENHSVACKDVVAEAEVQPNAEPTPSGEAVNEQQSEQVQSQPQPQAQSSSPPERVSPAGRVGLALPLEPPPERVSTGRLPPININRRNEPETPNDDSKLQSRFKTLAAEENEAPSSPQMFAASRNLNRSIGVRRRTSEGSQASQHEQARREDDEADKGPDPLREQFEREKDNNPILIQRRPTATNGISARNSEKSMKSQAPSKRPSVGFALGEDDGNTAGGGGAVGGGEAAARAAGYMSERDEVDPEEHMEAERIASISMPIVEPARAVTDGAQPRLQPLRESDCGAGGVRRSDGAAGEGIQ